MKSVAFVIYTIVVMSYNCYFPSFPIPQTPLDSNRFEILPPANDTDVDSHNDVLERLDDQLSLKETLLDATKSAEFADFCARHITSRTYFFQVRKCNDPLCSFHKPIRGQHEIEVFPDPVPSEVDGVLHYHEGVDPNEKYLPSLLENVEKQDSGIPFQATAHTAGNVGFTIVCTECKKPRLLHAKNKLKDGAPAIAKRMIKKIDYMCGATLQEYMGSGGDRDVDILDRLFVRANLSCTSKIELPYYSVRVGSFPMICIYCGTVGTKRTLNNSVENYPKCQNCVEKPDIVRRKRKTVVQGDSTNKKTKK